MTDNTELLPCPRCQCEAVLLPQAAAGVDRIRLIPSCGDETCALHGPSFSIEAEATEWWNTRPTQGHDALVEALTKARDTFREYERSHNWKADEADNGLERNNRLLKADRNREMAAICDAALTNLPTPQAEASPLDDGLLAELRAELEAIQGPKNGEDEHPEWLSTLLNVCRDIEDEGDRVYFGSTNDADDLRDVVEALEQAHHPLHLFRRPDLHRHNGELRKLNEAQAARIAELADENTALRARPSGDGEGE